MNKCLILLIMLLGLMPLASAGSLDKEICPCSEAAYLFKLKNSQNSIQEYYFSADKFSKQTNFSENPALVKPGETKIVYAYVTPDCSLVGDYEFNFLIANQGKRTRLAASLNISLCSGFGISLGELLEPEGKLKVDFHKGMYNICKGDIKRIPFMVINKENRSNNFFFNIKDSDFAKLSQESAALKENKKGIVYINLTPDKIGNYSLFLDVTQERGMVKKTYKIDLNVEECYEASIDIEKKQDRICSGEKTYYDAAINNKGVFDESFNLSTNIGWAGFDNNIVDIGAGKEVIAKLILEPLIEDTGGYNVEVKASVIGTKVEAGDSLKLRITPKESCYNARIVANSKYYVSYFGERIPIKIKNNGLKDSDFGISLEGPAWADISQDKISLLEGETKSLNIFAKPGEDIEPGVYKLNITLAKDGLSYSKSIDLELSKREEIFSNIKVYFNYYIYYAITGIVLLAALLTVLALIRRKIKMPKKLREPKEKIKEEVKKKEEIKKEAKKIEKKIEKDREWVKPFFKALGIMLSVLIVLGVIGYLFYRFKLVSYVESYIPFAAAGFGLLIILILVVNYFRKKPKKRIKAGEKKPEEKEKKIEKKAEKKAKKETKEKLHIFVEFVEYLIILIVLGAVVYFVSKIRGVESTLMYYLNYALLGFAVLVILVMIINKFRRIKGREKKKDEKKEVKKEEKATVKKEAEKARKRKTSKPKYSTYLLALLAAIVLGLFLFNYAFHQFAISLLSAPYAYAKDFALLYYKYIITGFAILLVLILLLKYYRKFFAFLMEEDKEEKK